MKALVARYVREEKKEALGKTLTVTKSHEDQISKTKKVDLKEVQKVKYLYEFDRYVQKTSRWLGSLTAPLKIPNHPWGTNEQLRSSVANSQPPEAMKYSVNDGHTEIRQIGPSWYQFGVTPQLPRTIAMLLQRIPCLPSAFLSSP
jgi:hypothetical protein